MHTCVHTPTYGVNSISDCRTVQTRHVANHGSKTAFFSRSFHLHYFECVLQTSLLVEIFASSITNINACFHVCQTLCLQSEIKFQVNFDLQCASVLSTLGYVQPLNFRTQLPSYKLGCTTRILGGNVLECLLIQLITYECKRGCHDSSCHDSALTWYSTLMGGGLK